METISKNLVIRLSIIALNSNDKEDKEQSLEEPCKSSSALALP